MSDNQPPTYVGGGAMAWACMSASGTGSMVFIDNNVSNKGQPRMNTEVYIRNLKEQIEPNALWLDKIL